MSDRKERTGADESWQNKERTGADESWQNKERTGADESSDNGSGSRSSSPSAADAIGRLAQDAEAIREYATHYVAARIDRIKATFRELMILAVAGVLGFVTLVVGFIMGLVLTFEGVAGALGTFLGDRPWLGSLLAGLILLTLVGGGSAAALLLWQRRTRRRLERKYDKRRRLQEARFSSRLTPGTGEESS